MRSARSSSTPPLRSLVTALLLTVGPAGLAQAETWVIDPAHSRASFKVRHLMISNVEGHFRDLEGTIEGDPARPEAALVNATIATTSIDTANQKRDDHLRSPDFFDVKKFPTITFRSKRIEGWTGTSFKLVGDLTMRGMTREVALDVTGLTPEITDPWGNAKRGMTATTTLDRKDFGIEWNKALDSGGVTVGDEVKVTLELEIQKKA